MRVTSLLEVVAIVRSTLWRRISWIIRLRLSSESIVLQVDGRPVGRGASDAG